MNFSLALSFLKAGRRVRQPTGFWIRLEGEGTEGRFVWESLALGLEQWFPTTVDILADTWEVEIAPLPTGEFVIQPQEPGVAPPGDLIFCVAEDVEVLRFRGNGDVLVRGNLIESDQRVLKAFKEFLVHTPYGEPFRAELVADGVIVEPRTRFERVIDDAD
jgi:hypothetical protein